MMMRKIEPLVTYDTVGSSDSENNNDGYYDNYENNHDEFGGASSGDEEANNLLESSSTKLDGSSSHLKGTALRWSRIRCGYGSPPKGSIWRFSVTNCWLFAVLATLAVTVSWMWSIGDGASNLRLLQIQYAASLPKAAANPGELISMPRPDLHELIADFDSSVTGNVSWLMDFAILGHAKCSTTSHLRWLRRQPEILMYDSEVSTLAQGRPAKMVSLLYGLPNRPNRKRGYKSTGDIMSPRALDSLRTHWPDAKIIVGVRHPVKWFESYYNYFKHQAALGKPYVPLGPAETMDVPSHAYFHAHLSLLGKTNLSDPTELTLLERRSSLAPPVPMTNKVFLYESTQPYDLPNRRNERYRWDLQTFLGLTEPLSPIPLHGKTDGDTYNYSSPDLHYDIDICEDKYAKLRRKLVRVGTAASEWILTYFVPHPDVTVSSPERFEELLRSWSLDPCKASRKKS